MNKDRPGGASAPFHILDPRVTPSDEQAQAAAHLIHALRAYLK